MNELKDAIAAATAQQTSLDAAVDSMEARVNADLPGLRQQVTDLNAKIAELQAQIDAGNNDPALVQAVNDLTAKSVATQQRIDNTDPAIASPASAPGHQHP